MNYFTTFLPEFQCVYETLIYNQYEHQKVFGLVYSW